RERVLPRGRFRAEGQGTWPEGGGVPEEDFSAALLARLLVQGGPAADQPPAVGAEGQAVRRPRVAPQRGHLLPQGVPPPQPARPPPGPARRRSRPARPGGRASPPGRRPACPSRPPRR